jgi:hypothetical protein
MRSQRAADCARRGLRRWHARSSARRLVGSSARRPLRKRHRKRHRNRPERTGDRPRARSQSPTPAGAPDVIRASSSKDVGNIPCAGVPRPPTRPVARQPGVDQCPDWRGVPGRRDAADRLACHLTPAVRSRRSDPGGPIPAVPSGHSVHSAHDAAPGGGRGPFRRPARAAG